MGISPGEAKRLSYWEFTAARSGWNRIHRKNNPRGPHDFDGPVELPKLETVRERMNALNKSPFFTGKAE